MYKYFKQGIRNWPSLKLAHFLISLHTFFTLYDFAYNRRISLCLRIFNKRAVISSHAVFETAQTKTQFFFEDRIISSIAQTNVLVFPVP